MSIKSQLRAAHTPSQFIECAKQAIKLNEDPNLIIPSHFGEMTAMIFSEVSPESAKHFNAMHGLATHARQGARLIDPFYRAAQSGFAHISVERRVRKQYWCEFFEGVAPLIRGDKRLTAIATKETVSKVLPNIVWSINGGEEEVDTATGIITALGGIPEAVAALDPEIVKELVKCHIKREGGMITAAPKLMELRKAKPFEDAIVAAENERGVHVAACTRVVREGAYSKETMMFVFEFNRQAEDLQVFTLEQRRNGWVPTVLKDEEDGSCREHGEVAADALIDYSLQPLPGQEWVRAIAEKRAFEIV